MTDTNSGKVVHFPRHLSTPPVEMELPRYLEWKYEAMFQEPWSKLEERVRSRRPEFFAMYDAMQDEPETEIKKRWWEIWK